MHCRCVCISVFFRSMHVEMDCLTVHNDIIKVISHEFIHMQAWSNLVIHHEMSAALLKHWLPKTKSSTKIMFFIRKNMSKIKSKQLYTLLLGTRISTSNISEVPVLYLILNLALSCMSWMVFTVVPDFDGLTISGWYQPWSNAYKYKSFCASRCFFTKVKPFKSCS